MLGIPKKQFVLAAALTCLISMNPSAKAQSIMIRARLLSPISTKTSKAGDKFTLNVLFPPQYTNGVIEGHIVKSKRSGKIHGKSTLRLGFDSLTIRNRTIPIRGELRAVKNSKGVANVDDEGRAIGHSSRARNVLILLGLTAAGAAAGQATGGRRGAELGGAAGAALAAGIVLSTRGHDLEFVPGSEFTIQVYQRGH